MLGYKGTGINNVITVLALHTRANCLPILPIVIPPEKNIQGSHDRTYRKSGAVYLGTHSHLAINHGTKITLIIYNSYWTKTGRG